MDENLHDIDKLFRDPIEEHEDMPSARIWNAIDANLDKSNIVSIKKKYNNLKKIAVALLLLLLGAVVYEIQTKKTADKNTAVNTGSGKNSGSTANNNSDKLSDARKNTKPDNQPVNWSDSLANNFSTNNAIKNTDDKTSTIQDNNTNKNEKEKKRRVSDVSVENTVDKGTKVNKVYKEDKVNKVNRVDVAEKVNIINGVKENESVSKINKVNKEVKAGEELVKPDMVLSGGKNKSGKKTAVAKTKMRVQNGTAELLTDASDDEQKNNNKDNSGAELMQPENARAEKLVSTTWENNSKLKQITAARLSPDAKLKNSIRMPKPFHWSVTPFASTQFSFNRMEDDHHDPGPQPRNNREQIKKEEQHHSASSVGVLVDISLSRKWGLQSGITYINQATTMEPKKIFAKMDTDGRVKYRFDCSSGYTYISLKTGTAATPVVGDSVTAAASTNTLKYIGIPLVLTYSVNLGKFSIVPSFGTVANFLVKQQIETEITQPGSSEKQTINSIQGLKSSYFNAYSGIAFEYNLNKRVAFNVIPAGNFALSAINKDAAVKSFPNSFALTGGVKIKF